MALEAPLRSSTGSLVPSFSQHRDMSVSSDPAPPLYSPFITMSSASSADGQSLRPHSIHRIPSSNLNLMSPSDIVGPSPVTSNGTETTEIEDEMSEEALSGPSAANPGPQPQLMMLSTNIPDQLRQSLSEEAVSVIHAPESFASWTSTEPTAKADQPSEKASPEDDKSLNSVSDDTQRPNHTVPPLSTDVRPVRYSVDSATPRAQDLQDMLDDPSRLRSSSASSLEKIVETGETEAEPDYDSEYVTSSGQEEDSDIRALRTALQECWTLCNTLANLSSNHRTRVFHSSDTPNAHEKAWKTCWKLCQRLYDNRDEISDSFNVRANLDLCRDFCQALFDIRQRKDEIADSVLRVSFELNNHLYSAQDNRNLPEAFRERTLDFYITLCHRLMKQRSELVEETDSLLRSCWSLAEMLFSLRQNRRDGKAPDEELLGSAVQACWELCDIFRDGWTQVRPDRNTPRPSQTSFFSPHQTEQAPTGRESRQSNRSSLHSKRESLKSVPEDRPRKRPTVPETPVTEFEDTPISPESRSPQVPNILVLGTNPESNRGGRWSSSASNLSSYSQSSTKTSSTATTATAGEDINITRIKALILKAAMNIGFTRDTTNDGKAGVTALQTFVKSLPAGSFGSLPAHTTLLQSYKAMVLADPALRGSPVLPARGKRLLASDLAKSVNWMVQRSPQHGFLRDLFKLVLSFPIEEVETRKNVSIAI